MEQHYNYIRRLGASVLLGTTFICSALVQAEIVETDGGPVNTDSGKTLVKTLTLALENAKAQRVVRQVAVVLNNDPNGSPKIKALVGTAVELSPKDLAIAITKAANAEAAKFVAEIAEAASAERPALSKKIASELATLSPTSKARFIAESAAIGAPDYLADIALAVVKVQPTVADAIASRVAQTRPRNAYEISAAIAEYRGDLAATVASAIARDIDTKFAAKVARSAAGKVNSNQAAEVAKAVAQVQFDVSEAIARAVVATHRDDAAKIIVAMLQNRLKKTYAVKLYNAILGMKGVDSDKVAAAINKLIPGAIPPVSPS